MTVLFDQSKFDVLQEELSVILDELLVDQQYLLDNNDPEFYQTTYLPKLAHKDYLLAKAEELIEASQ